MTCEVSKYFCE